MLRVSFHLMFIGVLTLLTQVGGVAWVLALFAKRKFVAFLVLYAGLSLSALFVAPYFGRVPLSCASGQTLQVHSWTFCALNRQYVVPELHDVLHDAAAAIAERHPGTVTLVLDASFPFFDSFPLLPHLSHHDGRKADIALFYQDDNGYLPKKTRSPLGYFAFEDGPSDCPPAILTLRWNADPMQSLWPDLSLDSKRTRFALLTLTRDKRVSKVFIEPHLKKRLEITHPKLRFQGCRAARHDDHIHIQL